MGKIPTVAENIKPDLQSVGNPDFGQVAHLQATWRRLMASAYPDKLDSLKLKN